ncbi:MAG: hypothetical protein A2381_12785 [Bdellovibrionales bacterium RIFOXYB1_FULL_37_110]|nr:MAG: hypothetical protein A2181_02110 [Bdellovibrionales bacterium RIFOXYA1_FULL_38_20]OFZ51582.1 MAG: hypothetical protein A2417_12445 [Bdellovibrionales bacterium RIFOXYC1_FULL_37_79]OFZ60409.1 MAG: hypothetical protein A2381_12785 [Bdellovibrionales bacterium RIFOXYB1_FULL_37_110]OFZ64982.1 MAG: hypothetical protein A2577_09050 [Bdellovibrionales bacterium RIFOXYD1_FULL_36_51]
MFMAIATQTFKHPSKKSDYRIWYLEINSFMEVIGIGVISREKLIEMIFENYQKTGSSNWRVFKKNEEESSPIEIYDFVAQNIHENTHFGNLPTLEEFQATLAALTMRLEIRSIA